MPRGLGNDDDWQRHNADRNGQEGRNQDRTGSQYEIGRKQYHVGTGSKYEIRGTQYRGSVLYVQLSGVGPENGAWVSEHRLLQEFPALYKELLRQGAF